MLIKPAAPVTRALIFLIVLGFIHEVIVGVPLFALTSADTPALIRAGALYPGALEAGEWWRLFTIVLVHVGLLHLVFNLWALYQLGMLYEVMFSSSRMLVIFLVTALVASLSSFFFTQSVTAGASGAIFGLLGALITGIRRSPYWRGRRTAGLFEMLLMWAGLNVVFGFTWAGIDNAAHLGGFIAGAILGLIPHPDPPQRPGSLIVEVGDRTPRA